MKRILIITLLLLPLLLYSQQKQGVIYPGKTFTNFSPDTLFCLKKQQLESLMEREALNDEILNSLRLHNTFCDSLISLKTGEAENWYQKLLENDTLLEQEKIKFAEFKHKSRKKNALWFGAGIITAFIIGAL